MLYTVVGISTFVLSSLCVLTQLVLLPWLNQHTVQLKSEFESRLRRFHHNARQFDEQYRRLGQLVGSASSLSAVGTSAPSWRVRRQLLDSECPPPRRGSPGQPGLAGDDGESGDAGEDGPPGLDAITLLMEEAQKCVVCPPGPAGPIGAPGLQGFVGAKGDKGEPGMPGTDGIDGEQGPEGLPGHPGIAGKQGKKGGPGMPAPGGTGPPGAPGVKGPPGPTGKQGERGRRNFVIGMPGLDGRVGKQGLDGLEGKPGARGEKGENGENGADAKFCPCPSELTMGGAKKPVSHLAPPPSAPMPPAVRELELKVAAPPAAPLIQPPAAPATTEKPAATEKATKASTESVTRKSEEAPAQEVPSPKEEETHVFDGTGATNGLRIAPLQPGERPEQAKREEGPPAKNKDYEDVYPNYESPGERQHSLGSGKSAQTEEDVPQLGENNGALAGPEELGEEDSEGQETPPSTRRFVYVTKRPRPKL